jgi:hypothetical protein
MCFSAFEVLLPICEGSRLTGAKLTGEKLNAAHK